MPEMFTVLVPVETAMLEDPDVLPFAVHYIWEQKLEDERGTRVAGPLRITFPKPYRDVPDDFLNVPAGWTIIRIDGVGEPA